jgi:hypothetical protein
LIFLNVNHAVLFNTLRQKYIVEKGLRTCTQYFINIKSSSQFKNVSQFLLINTHYICQYTTRSFRHSWFNTGFVTRVTRRLILVEQVLLTPTGHLSSPPIFIWVRVARSFVFCVVFCRLVCIPFVFFSVGPGTAYPSGALEFTPSF